MAPPVWIFVFLALGLMALGVWGLGRGLQESLDARARGQRAAQRAAESAKADADLIAGITGVLDPLGIIV